jgi:hypothetical protein
MALTDNSDLFVSVHEDGMNALLRHIMQQRPPLFNYGTALFEALAKKKRTLCSPIKTADNYNGPLITVEDPLPILGSPLPIGMDWCFQLSGLAIDFHKGNTIALPPELGVLQPQQFALQAKACFGLMCPDDKKAADILEQIEGAVVTVYEQNKGLSDKERLQRERERKDRTPKDEDVKPLPPGKLYCFCLSLFLTGHFEWDDVPGSDQPWLKVRLDGLEIVDIGPDPLESMIECYLRNILRYGILPRIMLPMEALVLDITSMSDDLADYLGRQILLQPTPTGGAVPFNPAVEDDQLKLFIELNIV